MIESLIETIKLRETLEEIDLLAEAGLCQFSVLGKHAFLKDIRRKIAELGIQGGVTSVRISKDKK